MPVTFDLPVASAARLCNQFLQLFVVYIYLYSATVTSSCALNFNDNAIPATNTDGVSVHHHRMQEEVEYFTFVDVCESESGFERLSSGVNPDSEVVQLHPSTWVFVTACRHAGRPCSGYGGALTLCRPKKSWVQAYGKIEGDTWRYHWIAVTTSCTCAMKAFPYLSAKRF